MERRKEQRRKRDENHLRDDKLCGCYPSCRFHRRSGADRRATETAKPEIPPEVFAEIERQHKEMDAATGVTPELAAMKFKQPAPASPPDEKCGRGIWLGKASYNCELPKYHEGSCSPTPPATAVQPPAPPDTPAAAPNGGRDDLRKKSCDVWNPQQRASVFIRTAIPNIGDVLMMTCEPSGNRIFLSDILGEYQQWLERASVPTLAPSTSGDSREATRREYLVEVIAASRDFIVSVQKELGFLPQQQAYSAKMTEMELLAAKTVASLDEILAGQDWQAAAHRSAADRQEIERLRAGFCEKHAPNAAQRYSGCVICSRNEESALIEEVLKSFGWAHAEEAELYLHGSQWYCIGDEERGTWDTAAALTKALEDYDSLREAHKKARLFTAKEQARAERAESELEKLRGLLRRAERMATAVDVTANGRWSEWGDRACNAADRLDELIEMLRRALSGEERDSRSVLTDGEERRG